MTYPFFYSIAFDLRVEGCGFHSQQPGRASLPPSRSYQRTANHLCFETMDFALQVQRAGSIVLLFERFDFAQECQRQNLQ